MFLLTYIVLYGVTKNLGCRLVKIPLFLKHNHNKLKLLFLYIHKL